MRMLLTVAASAGLAAAMSGLLGWELDRTLPVVLLVVAVYLILELTELVGKIPRR